MRAVARANTNIALVKYWGKRDARLNLPAVGSLSLTLDGLETRTEVTFDDGLAADELELGGKPTEGARGVTQQLPDSRGAGLVGVGLRGAGARGEQGGRARSAVAGAVGAGAAR